MMIRMVLIILLFAFPATKGLEVIGPDNDHSGSSSPQTYPPCLKEDTTWSTTESTMIPGVEDPYSCQSLCQESATCHQFTWYNQQAFPLNLACFLYDHPSQESPCTNCVSGPKSCTCHVPEPQKHGDWFCPPSGEVTTCHLECHPGYVSDNRTVITCQHGEWSSAPSCVVAIALITGSYESPHNTVEVYSEGLHLRLPNLPNDADGHSLDLVDSAVLLCGGYHTLTSCLVMTSSQQWLPHSTTTSQRYRHSSVSALGQLHLLGGYHYASHDTSEYLARSSTTWSEGWQLLEFNFYACTAKVAPEVAIMTGGVHKSSVISYNVTSGAATRLQDLISPTYGPGCCYIRDEGFRGVLVAGGDGDYGYDFSQLYDINTGEWSTTGKLTTGRFAFRMFVIGEQILAAGGTHGSPVSVSTVDRFNLTSRTWEAAEDMLDSREDHAVTAVPPSAVGIGSD